jgi:hypothetical protein
VLFDRNNRPDAAHRRAVLIDDGHAWLAQRYAIDWVQYQTANSPPYAHLAAVYCNFDWDGPLDFVNKAAGLSDTVFGGRRCSGDSAVRQWFGRREGRDDN